MGGWVGCGKGWLGSLQLGVGVGCVQGGLYDCLVDFISALISWSSSDCMSGTRVWSMPGQRSGTHSSLLVHVPVGAVGY